MGIGDAIGIMSCLAGMMLAMPILIIFLSTAFNTTTNLAVERLHRGIGIPFILGVLASAAIIVPAAMLVSMGSIFQFFGVIAYLGFLAWAFTGLGAVARLVGGRMFAASHTPLYIELIVGAFVMSFAIAFPLVGWLLIFPVASVIGIGSTVAGLPKRRTAAVYAEAAAEMS